MRILSVWALCAGLLMVLGCGQSKTEDPQSKTPVKTTEDPNKKEEAHHHPDKGPHDGQLVELGEEEYHAEWIVDKDKGTVTVYILDSTAKEAVPIEAEEISFGAKSKVYPLAAQALEGEPMGQSSRFVASDKELSDYLGSSHVHATLILKISGKPYSGKVDSH